MESTELRPRLPLVSEEEMDAECRALMQASRQRGTPSQNYMRILANQPELMKGFLAFWKALFWEGEVDADVKEAVRIYVAKLSHCEN